MPYEFAAPDADALPLHVIESDALEGWLGSQPADVADWVRLNGFKGRIGQALLVPGAEGAMALAGYGSASQRARGHYALAAAVGKLPEGTYALASGLEGPERETEALGWLLCEYRFDRYHGKGARKVALVVPEGIDAKRVETVARAEAMVRDLVNTPTSDMGPDQLEAAARQLAEAHGAAFSCVVGDDLLEQNFPMIHAVGRASTSAPRLIEFHWGGEGPALTLVGKGVCFDTGGLDIKPASSMKLMKKDM
ncbi:MAG: leucyl aminopeptidase family protein, partial [Pseudooceanicola sp.]|nr:leucyl aminopeptidase family protein [Pseudooceanicola sp.]